MLAWPGPWLRHRACARYRCKRTLCLACLVPACGVAVSGVRFGGQLAAALPRCGLFASGLRPLASRSRTRRRRRGGGQCCATRRSAAKVSGTPLAGNKVASWRCTARTAASSTLTREATAWTRLRTAAHPAAACGNVQAGEPSGACGRKPSGCAGRRVRQMVGSQIIAVVAAGPVA